jgi:hypothetical protein|tara:strand:- start:98 stop:1579 length:1482 start_codon:yes stop_codon:yes gene_type:complete
MSVTRTFTVTVGNPGAGNRYYLDGVLQATINIAENGTYRFDQSDGSNNGHPLKFSTTSNGTHSGGSEYTTGVTYNGTPGQAGAYTQIVVAVSAPTLYYYCQYHSGMGGQANTVDDDTYGMWAWGTNEWGDQGPIVFTPTGVAATSSVGSVVAAQTVTAALTGVQSTSSVGSPTLNLLTLAALTGVSATSAVGAIEAENAEGWGRQEFGNSGWGVDFAVKIGTTGAAPSGLTSSLGTPVAEEFLDVPITAPSNQGVSAVGSITTNELLTVPLTGLQSTSELGSFDNAGTLVGWGRNGWGEEPYGDSFNKLVQPAGLSSTSSVGAIAPDGLTLGITAPSAATSSVGSLSLEFAYVPTGQSATSSVGQLLIGLGVTLTGVSATSSVGAIAPADVMGLTGLLTTSSVGSLQIDNTELVEPTGQSATSSVGSLITEIGVPLTGLSTTSSVGTILPDDVVGLTGVSVTASISPIGVAPLGYETITATQTANYTSVNAGT